MNQKAEEYLLEALWSIHQMLQDLNEGNNPDAEDIDTLENEIENFAGELEG